MDVCQPLAALCTANCSSKTKRKNENNSSSPAQATERTGSSEISLKQKGSESPWSWCPLAQSLTRWGTVCSSCAQGVSWTEIPQLTSLLPNSWQRATGFQTVCKLKISFRVSCKTVGEMLAYCFFPPFSFLLSCSQQLLVMAWKKTNPKPTFCSFSVSMVTEQSWPKQLSCLCPLRCLKTVIKMRSCRNTVSVMAVTFALHCWATLCLHFQMSTNAGSL